MHAKLFNCVCFYLYWLYLPKTKVLLGEVYKHSYSCSLILVDLWAENSNFVCMHLPLLTKQYILGFRNIVFLTIKNRLEKSHDKFDCVIISFRFQWLDSDCSRIQKKRDCSFNNSDTAEDMKYLLLLDIAIILRLELVQFGSGALFRLRNSG